MSQPGSFISVIIPAYNSQGTIGPCLESLCKSDYPNFECIVVDDHSLDRTARIAESFKAKVIQMGHRGGAAHARNQGAEKAKGDILLFIDADVTTRPDCLSRIVKSFEAKPGLAALFGSYDAEPGCPNFLSQYRNMMHHYIHQSSSSEASTFWSACGAIRKDVFFNIGKYNDETRMMEDIELGYRLKTGHHEILLNKDIQVKHWKCYTFSKLLKSDLFDRAIPWTELMWKYRQFTTDLNLKGKHKLSATTLLLGLFFLLLGLWIPWSLLAVPILMFFYLRINSDFYRFFLKKKGALFAIGVIPLHMLYYFYSTLGYLLGTAKYWLGIGRKNIIRIARKTGKPIDNDER